MILVTGGAGYIGSHFLSKYLSDSQAEAVVVDNFCTGHRQYLPACGVHLVEADIGNAAAMDAIFHNYAIEAVVHFAGSIDVGESQKQPFKYWRNNVIESLCLFESMKRNGVRNIVFSSTCASYGNPQYLPIDEKHPQAPVNVYGTSKFILEKALASLAETLGWRFVALRYFNAAGADVSGLIGESHDPESHLIPLVLQVANGALPEIKIYDDDYDTADGTCIRDFVHVTDLAEAHLQALELIKRQPIAEYVNLGTEQGVSVKEVIQLCRQITGKEITTSVQPRRPGDAPILVAKAEEAAQLLNWRPRYDLRAIIETAWRWEQNRRY